MFSDIDSEIESCEWEMLGMDVGELKSGKALWVQHNEVRWAQHAEYFWEQIVECMRRMFFEDGVEFRSGMSSTCVRLSLNMKRETGHVVEIGHMGTYLAGGIQPVMRVDFRFSCLDDVCNIWKNGFLGAPKFTRLVFMMPDTIDRVPRSANVIWCGTVSMRRDTGAGDERTSFSYTSNPLDTHDFIDCMFKGEGDDRMRWIGTTPDGYRRGQTRHGADRNAGIFKTATRLDPMPIVPYTPARARPSPAR